MSATTPEPPSLDTRRLLVVSPHFDDAVLSCGHLLANAELAVSVTVFGGAPVRYQLSPTNWDRLCGFQAGDEIVTMRREEDAEALAILGASATVLDFLDLQYRDTKNYDMERLINDLRALIGDFRPTAIAMPLAIQHPDHRACLAAALATRNRDDRRDWVCYAEFPYVWREPDLAARRLAAMRRDGYRVTPVLTPAASPTAKAAALRSYGSQLVGLELVDDVERVAEAPEQLWRLSDRPPFALRAARRAGYKLGILK